jgi:hypothetical protein
MWTNLLRIALPILVLAAGTASLVIGVKYHRTPVAEEKTRIISVVLATPYDAEVDQAPSEQEAPGKGTGSPKVPAKGDVVDDRNPFEVPAEKKDPAKRSENPFAPPPQPATSLFDALPPQQPAAAGSDAPLPTGVSKKDVEEKYVDVQDEPERVLVREITFGGVVRLANGQLKRTYSGKPPALCPS